jgi:large subunit ribosomal protein L18
MISDINGQTILAASTLDKDVQSEVANQAQDKGAKSTKSVAAGRAVGIVLAKRAKEKKIDAVVFDRNGYVYHGRVQGVAEGLRQGGLKV